MPSEAVAHYHDLLADHELAQSSLKLLDEGLERAKLIFGGRRLSPYLRPHFVSEEDFARVRHVCETVWSAIEKVKDAAVADPSLLDELGLTEIERDLAMKRFAQTYKLRRFEGRPLMLQVLLDCYQEFLGRPADQAPHIAIVDLKGMPTQKEFELFREYFEAQGYPSIIAAPEDLEFSNGRLRAGEFEVDIVYKRLLVNEYLPIIKQHPALLDAYRARAICMVNSFRSKIIHKKALFAVVTDARHTKLFSEEERAMITGHVPWTRQVRAGRSDYYGDEIDLLTFISEKRDRLVLKPNDDYGGHGIYIGWNSDESAWGDAIQKALGNGDYVVQERVPTAREVFPALTSEGRIEFAEQLVDLDPLLFNGKVGSAFTRLSSNELANVTSGGGMVPTFLISKR